MRRRPDWAKSISGTQRADRAGGGAVAALADERITVAEPAPAVITDPRGVALWNELVQQLMQRNILTRNLLRPLLRYVALNIGMWRALEEGRVPAALSREMSSLEHQLGLASEAPSSPPARMRDSRWARIKREGEAEDTFVRTDPEGWAERCRRDAAKLDIDDPELDRLLEDDEYFDNDDQVAPDRKEGDEPT
jgi:hypothetical protein